MMQMQIMTVTPELAAAWLKSNTGNRRLRKWWVKSLADIIRRGEWVVSHQGVAFDTEGTLRDGQHRLSAIVEAGIPVQLSVTYGVPVDAYKVMDQGARRNASDISGIDKRVIEPCSLAARLAFGQQPSFAQIERVLNSAIGSAAIELVDYAGATRRFYSSAPMKLAAILTALKSKRHRDHAFAVYRAMVNLDFASMPPSGQALVRQERSGKISITGAGGINDALARGLAALDPDRAGLTRITVSADASAIATARAAVRATIGQAE